MLRHAGERTSEALHRQRCREVLIPCAAASSTAWLTVLANYLQHAVYRKRPWPLSIAALAHVLLALQITSFALVLRTPPGSPPRHWLEDAQRGLVDDATRDQKTGELVPPRARYVRRASQVVLHLDHYCWFLGVPIGLRNRKFFLLFLVYSLSLVVLALGLDVRELYCIATDARLGLARQVHVHPLPPSTHTVRLPRAHLHQRHASAPEVDMGAGAALLPWNRVGGQAWSIWLSLSESWAAAKLVLGTWYLWYILWLVPVNLCFLAFLADMTSACVSLAVRGRTSLEPDDATYDYGCLRNLRDVLGERVLLWPWPWPNSGSANDGLHWKRVPTPTAHTRRPWTFSRLCQHRNRVFEPAAKAV